MLHATLHGLNVMLGQINLLHTRRKGNTRRLGALLRHCHRLGRLLGVMRLGRWHLVRLRLLQVHSMHRHLLMGHSWVMLRVQLVRRLLLQVRLVYHWLGSRDSRRRLANNGPVGVGHHYIGVTHVMSHCRTLLIRRGANVGRLLYVLLVLYWMRGLVHHYASHLWRTH